MAFLVQDTEPEAQESPKKTIKELPQKVAVVVREKAEASINFLILWTAVAFYYFFSGLALVIHGRLPRGWKQFDRKQLLSVITNVGTITQERKEVKRYGRVVDLDLPAPKIDLTKS